MGGDRPGVGHADHTGAAEGHVVGVAPVGVGRQVHAVGMQTLDAAITGHDRVVAALTHPAVGGGRPMQVDGGRHAGTVARDGRLALLDRNPGRFEARALDDRATLASGAGLDDGHDALSPMAWGMFGVRGSGSSC